MVIVLELEPIFSDSVTGEPITYLTVLVAFKVL